jgi:hypothetical protein
MDSDNEEPEHYVIGQTQKPRLHWIVLLAESLLHYETWRELLMILRRIEAHEEKNGPITGRPKN